MNALADRLGWVGTHWPQISTVVAGLLLALTLWLLLPSGRHVVGWRKGLAAVAGIIGLVLLWWQVPTLGHWAYQGAFWTFAALTLAAAVATITAWSPVYSAIWFAVTLLGTSGLMLLQEAPFLAIATAAVYAGAILVTFLFVLMLAQPEGDAFYDRISWGRSPRFVASATTVVFAVLLAASVSGVDDAALVQIDDQQLRTAFPPLADERVEVRRWRVDPQSDGRFRVTLSVAAPPDQQAVIQQRQEELRVAVAQLFSDRRIGSVALEYSDVRTPDHTAALGAELFGRQLIAVQVAATLLLAALVGAVAIASRDTGLHDKSYSG